MKSNLIPSQKIRVGIVGLSADGGWGASAHYPSLSKLSELFEITGLTASTPAKAQAAAQKYGVPFATDNAAELAARSDVDLLVVAVNLPQHQALLEQILPSGKAVYCEWPLGTDPDQSRHLAALAAQYGCRNFIGLQALHSPYVNKIKQLLDDPATGRMLACTIQGSDPSRARTSLSRYRYAQFQENGVNTLTIPFGHLLSALRFLFGSLNQMHALTACQYAEILLQDTGETMHRTTTDHVFFHARTAQGGLIDAAYGGSLEGLKISIECEHARITITATNGHIQYQPLTIEIARSNGSRETFAPHTEAQENLVGAYRAVYRDLTEGTHTVPDFAAAAEHQQILFDLQG